MKDLTNTLMPSLNLVASEIGTQSMIIFPEDAELFYDPEVGTICAVGDK